MNQTKGGKANISEGEVRSISLQKWEVELGLEIGLFSWVSRLRWPLQGKMQPPTSPSPCLASKTKSSVHGSKEFSQISTLKDAVDCAFQETPGRKKPKSWGNQGHHSAGRASYGPGVVLLLPPTISYFWNKEYGSNRALQIDFMKSVFQMATQVGRLGDYSTDQTETA